MRIEGDPENAGAESVWDRTGLSVRTDQLGLIWAETRDCWQSPQGTLFLLVPWALFPTPQAGRLL